MGRLVLTRKLGEGVNVGVHVVIVTRVGRANANLMTESPRRVHNCAIGDIVILEPGVTITLAAINKGCARLVFDAQPHIKIMRTELDEHADNS